MSVNVLYTIPTYLLRFPDQAGGSAGQPAGGNNFANDDEDDLYN
jgi:hypothetical protein